MQGWYIFILLVLLVFGFWERKKYGRKLSELTSRLTQVEELLLEVCALVEEGQTANEPSSPAAFEEKKGEEGGEANRETIAQAPPSSAPAQEKKRVAPPEQPPSPPPQTGLTELPNKDGKKDKKLKIIRENLPEWNQQIIELWQQGLPVPEIARQTGKGQGEVQLIVELYCKERPQS
ncbi:MAG: hypothetical protein GX081_06540 [Firmicutes bacterium]|nr:hypothetical protein [Bacillota bacterium]